MQFFSWQTDCLAVLPLKKQTANKCKLTFLSWTMALWGGHVKPHGRDSYPQNIAFSSSCCWMFTSPCCSRCRTFLCQSTPGVTCHNPPSPRGHSATPSFAFIVLFFFQSWGEKNVKFCWSMLCFIRRGVVFHWVVQLSLKLVEFPEGKFRSSRC